jgi:hypothetical protein
MLSLYLFIDFTATPIMAYLAMRYMGTGGAGRNFCKRHSSIQIESTDVGDIISVSLIRRSLFTWSIPFLHQISQLLLVHLFQSIKWTYLLALKLV